MIKDLEGSAEGLVPMFLYGHSKTSVIGEREREKKEGIGHWVLI